MTQKECQRNGNNQRFADALIMSGLSWRGGGERLWSVETVVGGSVELFLMPSGLGAAEGCG